MLEEFKKEAHEIISRYVLIAKAIELLRKIRDEYGMYLRDDFTILNLPKITVEQSIETRIPEEPSSLLIGRSIYDALSLISEGKLFQAMKLLEQISGEDHEKILYTKLAILLHYFPVSDVPSFSAIERLINEIDDELIREYLHKELKVLQGVCQLSELEGFVKRNRQQIIQKFFKGRKEAYFYSFIFINSGDLELTRMVIDTFMTTSMFLMSIAMSFLFFSHMKDLIELENEDDLREYSPSIQSKISSRIKGYEWLLLPKLLLLWNENIKEWNKNSASLVSSARKIFRFWKEYCKGIEISFIPYHIRLMIDILGCVIPFLILVKRVDKPKGEIKEMITEVKNCLNNILRLGEAARKKIGISSALYYIEEILTFLAYAKLLTISKIFSPRFLNLLYNRFIADFVLRLDEHYGTYSYIYIIAFLKIIETLSEALISEKSEEYRSEIKQCLKEYVNVRNKPIIQLLLQI